MALNTTTYTWHGQALLALYSGLPTTKLVRWHENLPAKAPQKYDNKVADTKYSTTISV